jgi:hypothetical protein
MEPGEATNMVDVRVGADDGSDREMVAAKNLENALDFVTRIHDDCLVRGPIAEDRAVALQQPHGNHFVYELRGHQR